MKKRYAFLDVIRLFSMLGIVYYHMLISLYLCGIRQYDSIRPLFENNNIHIAKICVGLFFMISGAGLMLSTKDKEFKLKSYYLKRIVRILIPFYLVYILYLVSFMLLTHQRLDAVYSKDASVFSIIFTFLGMDAYVSSFGIPTFSLGIGEWFLGALVMMYIVFPIIRWALLKSKWISLILMSVYYIIILVTYPMMSYAKTVPGYVNFTCKIYEFFLGAFLILIIDRIPKWVSLGVSIPCILFVLLYPGNILINENLLVMLVNVVFFLFFSGVNALFDKIPRVMKIIVFLCGYTYEFFLIHHVVIDYMTLQHIGVPFSNKQIPMLFVQEFLVITILTALVKRILSLPGIIKKRRRYVHTDI